MPLASHRLPLALSALLACSVLSLAMPAARAQTSKPQAAAAAKAAPNATAPRARRQASPPEPATRPLTVEDIGAGQLDVAGRVLTGDADCEFKQLVSVLPVDGMPGYFHVTHQRKRYRMLPRETATGTVRLEDPDTGIVWLQIPAKSMLMNARIGQRLIDNCMHSEQRAAVNAVVDAAHSLGIVTPAAQPPVAAPAPAPATATAAAASASAPASAPAGPSPTGEASPPAAAQAASAPASR